MRYAKVIQSNGKPTLDEVMAYLPSNYTATEDAYEGLIISGEDVAGWTMDGYIIPRLGSGLITAREL
jgi:hypothetical protein